MKPKQESDRFLSLAYDDREACIALSKIENIKSHIICFHAQQAIEKALKAVIMIKNQPLTRTHDLTECAYQVEELGLHLPVSIETIGLLTPYAVIGRYGGIEDDIVPIEEAIEMMNIILEWASDVIGSLENH